LLQSFDCKRLIIAFEHNSVNDILKNITTSYLIQFVSPKTDFDLFKFILYEFCYNNMF